MAIPSPNYTQIPNVILDSLHLLSGAELKFLSLLCRQTFGFHREKAKLSLSFISKGTGLSRQGVCNTAESLLLRGWIERELAGMSFEFKLKIEAIESSLAEALSQPKKEAGQLSRPELVNSVDQSTELTSQLSRPELVNSVDQTSQLSRPELVNSVDPNKERSFKERSKEKERKDRCRDRTATPKGSSSKAKRKRPTAQEVYPTLRDLEKYLKSWDWYVKKLRAIQPDRNGKTPSPGDKVNAAIAWRDYVEGTDSVELFKTEAPKYNFNQIGVPHFERFLSGELWKNGMTSGLPDDFIQEHVPTSTTSAPDDRTRDRWLQEAREKGTGFYTLADGSFDQTKIKFWRENREEILGESYV